MILKEHINQWKNVLIKLILFNKFNTYPIAKFIFIDDSGDKKFKEEANKILSSLLKEYDYFYINLKIRKQYLKKY